MNVPQLVVEPVDEDNCPISPRAARKRIDKKKRQKLKKQASLQSDTAACAVTGSVHELHITAADECAASSTGHENAIEDEVAMLRAENAQLREDVITMQSNMEAVAARIGRAVCDQEYLRAEAEAMCAVKEHEKAQVTEELDITRTNLEAAEAERDEHMAALKAARAEAGAAAAKVEEIRGCVRDINTLLMDGKAEAEQEQAEGKDSLELLHDEVVTTQALVQMLVTDYQALQAKCTNEAEIRQGVETMLQTATEHARDLEDQLRRKTAPWWRALLPCL